MRHTALQRNSGVGETDCDCLDNMHTRKEQRVHIKGVLVEQKEDGHVYSASLLRQGALEAGPKLFHCLCVI